MGYRNDAFLKDLVESGIHFVDFLKPESDRARRRAEAEHEKRMLLEEGGETTATDDERPKVVKKTAKKHKRTEVIAI